jgi:hypothetical protein
MRARREIESETIQAADTFDEGLIQDLILEVLLDIRDLLAQGASHT